jgi:tetratricopeptide (TPR) repeat protein
MLEKSDARMPRSGEPFLAGDCSRLLAAVEGLAALGERERAAELYPLVLESLRTDQVVRRYGQGLVRTVAGIGAACARQWDEAEKHFGAALELAYALPHVVEQAEVRYWHARMLLERNAAGDRERANDLLGAAIEIYQKLGMPLHLARARELETS